MPQTIFTPFHYHATKRMRRILIGLGIVLWLGASVAVLGPIFPHVLYRLSPGTPQTLAAGIANTASTVSVPPVEPGFEVNLPPFDPELPKENYLVIKSVGINGQIHEGENWEEILKQGVWRVPNFPDPSSGKPVILASHRWGYLDWSNDFRRLNSFYNLPKTKVGDQIEIVWQQRQYFYEITAAETGTEITDYSADLILYTCELWESPVRVFRFAKRVN